MEIVFVLVSPAVPGNIGASARAIKTMGFRNLMLVSPGGFPHPDAYRFAYGSNDILEQAVVVNDLETAVKDCDLVIGTTARSRRMRKTYCKASGLCSLLTSKEAGLKKVAIVFGSEENGLSKKEIGQCHILSYVPLASAYPSLNLGQAVMLYAYELSSMNRRGKKQKNTEKSFNQEIFLQSMHQIMAETGMPANSIAYRSISEKLSLLGAKDMELFWAFYKYWKRKKGTGKA